MSFFTSLGRMFGLTISVVVLAIGGLVADELDDFMVGVMEGLGTDGRKNLTICNTLSVPLSYDMGLIGQRLIKEQGGESRMRSLYNNSPCRPLHNQIRNMVGEKNYTVWMNRVKEGMMSELGGSSSKYNPLGVDKEEAKKFRNEQSRQLQARFSTFTDTRDGQAYKTVKIGTQTWMAQNLNYRTERRSCCYENNPDNCEKYGRLYNWETAKIACPNGWRLPDTADWNSLVTTVGGREIAGKKLKSTSGWNDYKGKSDNGTDDFGFSALPGGFRESNGNFNGVGDGGAWWTATERNSDKAYFRMMANNGVNRVVETSHSKNGGNSVRCIQN